MGTSPDQLVDEIEQAREDLGDTIAEIGERLGSARSRALRAAAGVLGAFFLLRLLRRRRRED